MATRSRRSTRISRCRSRAAFTTRPHPRWLGGPWICAMRPNRMVTRRAAVPAPSRQVLVLSQALPGTILARRSTVCVVESTSTATGSATATGRRSGIPIPMDVAVGRKHLANQHGNRSARAHDRQRAELRRAGREGAELTAAIIEASSTQKTALSNNRGQIRLAVGVAVRDYFNVSAGSGPFYLSCQCPCSADHTLPGLVWRRVTPSIATAMTARTPTTTRSRARDPCERFWRSRS